jgi:hypothetical protein
VRTSVALSWLALLGAAIGTTSASLAAGPVFVLGNSSEPMEVTAPPDLEVSTAQRLGAGTLLSGVNRSSGAVELVLLGPGKALVNLPSPATSAHPQRPVALVDGESILGAAWLAGDGTRLTVEAATWQVEGWSNTQVIASPGPGSQLALRGGVAADGRPVLVWSRFDGEDDEIMWSRLEADGWSRARRVGADDSVPDITPALGLVGGQLSLAWSEWDGEAYRLRLARLEGDDWVAIGELPEKGAFAPQFEAADVLSYRDGEGQRWIARELATDGATKQLTTFVADAGPTPVRPQLLVGEGQSYWVSQGAATPAAWER